MVYYFKEAINEGFSEAKKKLAVTVQALKNQEIVDLTQA